MSSLMHEETMVSLQVYAPPLLLLLTFIITFYYFTRPSTKLNLPPSPPKLPVIGNIHQLGPILHRSLRDLSTRYGGPLMLMRMGSIPTLVVSSADAAREIMKTQDLIFATRPDVRRWRQILYDQKEVSVAPYGEEWRQFKSIMVLHFLSKNKVEAYREVREEETAIAVRKIKKSCDLKESVNLTDLFMKLTNDVVCRVTFGTKYSEGESGKKFKNMLKEYFDVLSELDFEDMIPWLWWVDRLRGTAARVEKVAKDVDEFLDGLVEERRRKPLTGGDGDHGREDFLEILIKMQKEGGNSLLDRDAIKGLLLDVYTAGTDTTTTVLEWIFAELLKHPRTFKKLQQEVRAILKDKKQINQEDIDNMKYLKAVIKETLRLHPPAPTLIPRVSREDAKVMGYDIMKGTRVIINGWAIQRDPKVWNEPDEFRPERFLDENNTIDYKGQDFGLIPFGAGRRGCPGMAFALAIDEHVLATLLHKFDWELPNGQNEDDLDMEEEPGITVHKKVPLFAMAKPFSS